MINTEKGYTLLFAVLTATLVLGVAVFIVGVTEKQYELSVQARNSIFSFFGADSGIECAINPGNWGTNGFSSTTGGTLICGRASNGTAGSTAFTNSGCPAAPSNIIADPSNPTANAVRQWCGYIPLTFTNGTVTTSQCARVTLTTGVDSSNGNVKTTAIESRGYNICTTAPLPDTSNTGTVERALRLLQSGVW
jgi:hypothetical protein